MYFLRDNCTFNLPLGGTIEIGNVGKDEEGEQLFENPYFDVVMENHDLLQKDEACVVYPTPADYADCVDGVIKKQVLYVSKLIYVSLVNIFFVIDIEMK